MRKLKAKMLTKMVGLAATILLFLPTSTNSTPVTVFSDHFDGTTADSSLWHIPTWVSSTDGTYIGRTQFRVTQNSPLPSVANSNVNINVESYNPTGFSFYGTDLISNRTFLPENGLNLKVRAKMDSPASPGVVGGIFLYALKPGSTTLHDEIDFELLGNKPNQVQTNVYANEPLGAGHPQFVNYTSGTIADYHTYEINWLGNEVKWLIDGNLVRTETNYVPSGPMYLHLNMWVPDSGWAEAYSNSIQPTSSPSSNQIFNMSVDSVNITVDPIKSIPVLTFNQAVPTTVSYPSLTTLSGKLTSSDSTTPIVGSSVAIQSKGADGVWRTLATALTGSDGTFSYKIKPTKNTYFRAYFAGNTVYNKVYSVERSVKVRPYIGISVKYPKIKVGTTDPVRFSANPKHAGSYVSIQKKSGTSWVTIAHVKLDVNSYGQYAFRPTRRGIYYFRVVLPKHSDHEAGTSKAVSVQAY